MEKLKYILVKVNTIGGIRWNVVGIKEKIINAPPLSKKAGKQLINALNK